MLLAPFKDFDNAFWSVSMISVDLPPPETPVTQVRTPKGKSTLMFCKLLPYSFTTVIFLFAFIGLLFEGVSINFSPLK